MLMVRGRTEPFQHRDRNRLTRTSDPEPNPLQRIVTARGETVRATLPDES
jgi:hypothetical protein